MYKKALLFLVLLFAMALTVYAQEIWVAKDGSVRNIDSRALLIDNEAAFLATKNEVYKTRDIKSKWEEVFSLGAGENEISCIGGNVRNLLVGTRRGLFRSLDGGRTWTNVFRTIVPEKSNILAIEFSKYNPQEVFIGTERGIFLSRDSGSRWHDISFNLKNKRVICLGVAKDTVYAAGDDGLYLRKNDTSGWERVYIKSAPEDNVEENTPEAEESEEAGNSINCITFKGSRLFIGLDKGILYSDDGGKFWKDYPQAGLSGRINHITFSQKSEKAYCATTRGVFEFDREKGRWCELYKGLDRAINVRRLSLEVEDDRALWAITENGLFRMEDGRYAADGYIDVEKNLRSFKIIFDNEPVFKELQQAALKFNEVSPEKIKKWRNEARLKALLPKVSVGMDKNRSTNSTIYTSATKDYVALGPDDISNGIDVSVSWELGDLIWSADQTSIDTRSRLTTQLRNDILDDLRRVYYERKRLQFELIQSPPRDERLRFEKLMRIQELTQTIDDLTGNYLTENMKSNADNGLLNGR